MAKTSIHFKPAKVGSVEAHNVRSKAYMDGVLKSGREFYIFQDLSHLNQSIVNPAYKGMTCAELFEKQKELYKLKTGQKPNLEDRVITNKKTGKTRTISGWSPIREGVIPIKEDTKLADFATFIKWCESNGLNVIRIDLHFDEGYENNKGIRTFNRHAHIVVDWLDWNTGKTAKLDAQKMSEAQDVIANSLGMERGEKKIVTGLEHLSPTSFKEKKAQEHIAKLELENMRLSDENTKLKLDNDTLRQANTGLSAKYMDRWQYKGRAEKAEADLESEKSARGEDRTNYERMIAKLREDLVNEGRRIDESELVISSYRRENNNLRKEIQRLSVVANRWERMYNELRHPDEPKKGISR